MNEQETFEGVMRDCGIDPDKTNSLGDKHALSVAFAAWWAQQLVIDRMQNSINNFKQAFNSL
jgi:3-mercaptopyruvate sulfurtransferase SseA